MEVLQDARRQTGLEKGLGDLLHDSGGLGRRLEDDSVARQEGWDEGVDEDQIGVLSSLAAASADEV